MSEPWHCAQTPNGPERVLVVCQREVLSRENELLRSILRKLKAGGVVEVYDTDRAGLSIELWGRGEDANVVHLTPAEAALFDAITEEPT